MIYFILLLNSLRIQKWQYDFFLLKQLPFISKGVYVGTESSYIHP